MDGRKDNARDTQRGFKVSSGFPGTVLVPAPPERAVLPFPGCSSSSLCQPLWEGTQNLGPRGQGNCDYFFCRLQDFLKQPYLRDKVASLQLSKLLSLGSAHRQPKQSHFSSLLPHQSLCPLPPCTCRKFLSQHFPASPGPSDSQPEGNACAPSAFPAPPWRLHCTAKDMLSRLVAALAEGLAANASPT